MFTSIIKSNIIKIGDWVERNHQKLYIIQLLLIAMIPLIVGYYTYSSGIIQHQQYELSNQPGFSFQEQIFNNSRGYYRIINMHYDKNPFTLINSDAQLYIIVDIFPQKGLSLNPKYLGKNNYATIYIPISYYYGVKGHRDISNQYVSFTPEASENRNGDWVTIPGNKLLIDISKSIMNYMIANGIEGNIHFIKCINLTYLDSFNNLHQNKYYSYSFDEFVKVDSLSFIDSKKGNPIDYNGPLGKCQGFVDPPQIEPIFKSLLISEDSSSRGWGIHTSIMNNIDDDDNLKDFSIFSYRTMDHGNASNFSNYIKNYYYSDNDNPIYSKLYFDDLSNSFIIPEEYKFQNQYRDPFELNK